MTVVNVGRAWSREERREALIFMSDNFLGSANVLGCLPSTAEQTMKFIMEAQMLVTVRNSDDALIAALACDPPTVGSLSAPEGTEHLPHIRWFGYAVDKSIYNETLREYMGHEISLMLIPEGGTFSCIIPKQYEAGLIAIWSAAPARRDVHAIAWPEVIAGVEYSKVYATYVPDDAANARLVELRQIIADLPDSAFRLGQVM